MHKPYFSIVLRYLILLIVGLNIALIYQIMAPLTVYPVYYFLHLNYGAILYPPNIIAFKGYFAQIVDACVAGSAYFFLAILNLATPMDTKRRAASLVFILISFYIINVFRIILFGTLLYRGYQYFDITHLWTWYFGSTLLVVILWFVSASIFKINSIPIYSDYKLLLGGLHKNV